MKLVLIGAGNLGHNLGLKLHEIGEEAIQVFSRTPAKASALAEKISALAISDLHELSSEADLYILAIKDSAIQEVAVKLSEIGLENKLIVHTSGATSSSVLKEAGLNRIGVFYPLQTFSIGKPVDFQTIPICVFVNNNDDLKLLFNLARSISDYCYEVDDEQRSSLHVAAVFANNFTNHLLHITSELLKENNLSIDVLMPLISETIEKIKTGNPKDMQTGPAVRGDFTTINNHLHMLETHPNYRSIYQLLSQSIQSTYEDNRKH